jgi:hypothetical protein
MVGSLEHSSRHIDTKGGASLGVPFFVLETCITSSSLLPIKQKDIHIDWLRPSHNILLLSSLEV